MTAVLFKTGHVWLLFFTFCAFSLLFVCHMCEKWSQRLPASCMRREDCLDYILKCIRVGNHITRSYFRCKNMLYHRIWLQEYEFILEAIVSTFSSFWNGTEVRLFSACGLEAVIVSYGCEGLFPRIKFNLLGF